MLQLIDQTKVPKFGADESWFGRLFFGTLLAVVDVDIALGRHLARIEDCKKDIFRLEVSMNDLLAMKVLHSFEDCEEKADSWKCMKTVTNHRVFVAGV